MSLRFDCLFYYASDLPSSIAFYAGVLGLRLLSVDAVARLDLDGVLVELVPLRPGYAIGGSGNARLCLATEDLPQVVSLLRGQGVPVSNPIEVDNGFIADLRDPDGNEICIFQYRTAGERVPRSPQAS